eukprot:4882974-Amphidinium_carterae.1
MASGVRDVLGQKSWHQPSQLERLVRSQHRLEAHLEDVKCNVERLVEVMCPAAQTPALRTMQSDVSVAFAEGSDTTHHIASSIVAAKHHSTLRSRRRSDEFDQDDASPSTNFHSPTLVKQGTSSPNLGSDEHRPHPVFENLAAAMARSHYAHVAELLTRGQVPQKMLPAKGGRGDTAPSRARVDQA